MAGTQSAIVLLYARDNDHAQESIERCLALRDV